MSQVLRSLLDVECVSGQGCVDTAWAVPDVSRTTVVKLLSFATTHPYLERGKED